MESQCDNPQTVYHLHYNITDLIVNYPSSVLILASSASFFAELTKHAPKVKKYIAFHDTQTYGTRSEEFMGRVGSNGLLPAIIHYMIDNPNIWKFKIHRTNNNGLSVIERV